MAVTGFYFVWTWSLRWYSAEGNSAHFTPGDLAEVLTIPLTLLTTLGIVGAVIGTILAVRQLNLSREQRFGERMERSLSYALEDFQKRYAETRLNLLQNTNSLEREETNVTDVTVNPFWLAIDSVVRFNPEQRDQRFIAFRSANYVLKPISAWCRWATAVSADSHLSETKGYDSEYCANRIIGAMDSTTQMYVMLCDTIELEKVVSERKSGEHVYIRQLESHVDIVSFLKTHSPAEFESIRWGNQGAQKQFEKFMDNSGWKINPNVRQSFF